MTDNRKRRVTRRFTGAAIAASGLAAIAVPNANATDPAPEPQDPNVLVIPQAAQPFTVHRGPNVSDASANGVQQLTCSGPIPTSPDQIDIRVAEDIQSRENVGFRADPAYVRSLYEDPSLTTGCLMQGMLFTDAEAHKVALNMSLSADAIQVRNYMLSSSYRSSFGGVLIDNQRGRLKVMLTDEATSEELASALTNMVGGAEYLEFSIARFNLDQLTAFENSVAEQSESAPEVRSVIGGLDPIVTSGETPDPNEKNRIVATNVNIADNRVDITVEKGSYDASSLPNGVSGLLERYGLTDSAISVTPGTAATLTGGAVGPPWTGGYGSIVEDATGSGTYSGWGMLCTNGFTLFDYSEPSARYMLTAGHCWHNSETLHLSYLPNKVHARDAAGNATSTLEGMGAAYYLGSTIDFGVWRAVSDQASNKVCNPGDGDCASVEEWQDGATVGSYVWRIGATSHNAVYGEVLSDNASAVVDDGGGLIYSMTGLIHINSSVQGGDSGGPVFQFFSGNNVSAIGTNESEAGSTEYAMSMGQFNSFSNWVDSASGASIGHLQPYLGG